MILSVNNNLDQIAQNSFLSNPIAIGGTTVPVRNINAFQANAAIQIGRTGEELSEVLTLTSATPSGTSLFTSGTFIADHPADTPVYNIRFNQVIFKRSILGTAGTATALTGGTLTLTVDGTVTEFNDTTGASTYAYKTQFYNSASGETSEESDWFIPGGPSFYSLQKIRERIKGKLASAGYIKDDATINDWINEWYEVMTNSAIKVNQDYLLGTVNIAFGTAGMGTVVSQDFKKPRKVEVTYDGVNFYKSTKIFYNQWEQNNVITSQVNPFHYWLGDTTFGILPTRTGGTARIAYYKLNTVLDSDTDELPLSMRGYTKSFVDYGLSCAFELDTKTSDADRYFGRAEAAKADFINEITPRDDTGPTYINFDEEVGPESVNDYDYLP